MTTIVRNVSLGSPAALVTTTGLRIADGIQFEEWRGIGRELWRISDQFAWCAGDWLAYGECYERGQYDQAVEVLERDYHTVRTYKRVALAVESGRRRPDSTHLKWSHFSEIAKLDPDAQDRFLDDCERHGWSVMELRREVDRLFGTVVESRPRLTVARSQDLYELCARAAQADDMDPGEWAAGVLEREARKRLAIEAA